MIEAPRAAAEIVSVSTNSAQSGILTGDDVVYLCDIDSFVLFGTNPTATTSCLRIPAKTLVRFTNIKPGEKLAAIAGASGTAYLNPGL